MFGEKSRNIVFLFLKGKAEDFMLSELSISYPDVADMVKVKNNRIRRYGSPEMSEETAKLVDTSKNHIVFDARQLTAYFYCIG